MVRDLGPYLAEQVKALGVERETAFVVASNLSKDLAPRSLIDADSALLTSLANLDIDGLTALPDEETPDRPVADDALALGVMTLRWLGADHAETLAFGHTGQLVLTKDKRRVTSFAVAGFPSDPRRPPRIPHIRRDKTVEVFDAAFRADILAMLRQAVMSILDPTAAKPPALVQKQAGKPWPVYVSLYGPDGTLAGQAGSHEALAPFEESLRRFAFDAVQEAAPALNRSTVDGYVIEVSVPYGFSDVAQPEDLIPLLNGIVVHHERKSFGFHPNGWRTYPDAHQLLSAICHRLGLKPWAYATKNARIESFRVIAFNEKEPFQDLRKPDKKKGRRDEPAEEPAGEGFDDGGAVFPF